MRGRCGFESGSMFLSSMGVRAILISSSVRDSFQLVSQLIHVQLVSLDFGPQEAINKIYNLLHHVLE